MTARAARCRRKSVCRWRKPAKHRAFRCTHPRMPWPLGVQWSTRPHSPNARARPMKSPQRLRGKRRVHAMGVCVASRTYPATKILVHAREHRDHRPRKRIILPPPRVTRSRHVRIPIILLARTPSLPKILVNNARSRASSVASVDMLRQPGTQTGDMRGSATHAVALGTLRASALLVLRSQPRTRVPLLPAQSRLPAKALVNC